MPFAWNKREPSRVGQIQSSDIPINEWLRVKWNENLDMGLGAWARELGEEIAYDEGKPEDPKILNKSFGIEGHLKFDRPMTIGRAALMYERKRDELDRAMYLESASHTWKSPKAALGFIAGLAGGFAHPADIGTAFIPFVGSSAKAAGLARIGGRGIAFDTLHAGRQAIARGLVAEEAIGAGKAAAFTASMMDGVLSQAAVEIPIALQKHRNQADYTLEDSAFNILFGGVFAGGLHLAGRGVGKLFEMRMKAAADVHERLDPDTKEAIFREHQDAFVEGRRPDTERIVALDEAVIRERVAFDEAAARAEAEAIIGRSGLEVGDTVIIESAGGAQGKVIHVAETIGGKELTVDLGPRGSLTFNESELVPVTANREVVDQIKKALPALTEKQALEIASMSPAEANVRLPDAIKRRDDLTKEGRTVADDERLNAEDYASGVLWKAQQAGLEAKTASERARRVSEYVDKKRKDWEATMEGRLSAERRAEITRQQEQGKLLPDDELAKYQAKPKVDAADVEMVMADVATLDKELKDMVEAIADPAEQAALRKELADLDADVYTDQSPMVKAAAPCAAKFNG